VPIIPAIPTTEPPFAASGENSARPASKSAESAEASDCSSKQVASSAYVHIPFCRRRCFYCDFAISVVGDRQRGETSQTMARYVETLIAEIQATPIDRAGDGAGNGAGNGAGTPLQTLFFGGGTPSLLSVPQLEAILEALDSRFGIADSAEISMEMDPATFDLAHLQGYRAAGVNRVSLGAQDFDDTVLAASGRFHRQQDILQAVEMLRQAGIDNFSLDLISGLPHQTLDGWQASLEQAIALSPRHISQYDLIVEPQTAFSRYFTPGEAPLPSEQHTAIMYRMAQQALTAAGYGHYEICNYAQPGYEARHNLTYWHARPCYGFGMGATSYLQHQRIDRPRTQRTYREWVATFIAQGGRTDDPIIPPSEQVLEEIMLGLRLQSGLSLERVAEVYGADGLRVLERAIAPYINNNWAIVEASVEAAVEAAVESAVESAIEAAPPPNPKLPSKLPIELSGMPTKALRTDASDGVTLKGQSPASFPSSSFPSLERTSRLRLSDPEGFLMSNQVIVDAFNALQSLCA
jgi:putative oxygen-independent coproporphyrinogen III oxidase